MLKYSINEYLELRLENDKTNIYVKNELFIQCKYLLLTVSLDEMENFEGVNSIDAVFGLLDSSNEFKRYEKKISPEVQFWGHCSNLQAWYENNYNSCLIHGNLAFPLLKKLTGAGDLLAKKVFKEEIAKRFDSGHIVTAQFILYNGYLNYLNKEELECVFEQSGPKLIENIVNRLNNIIVSAISNYRTVKDLIDLILFIDLKFNKYLLFKVCQNFPQEFREQFVKLLLLHLNFKEFNDYLIPYGKFYLYFEQVLSYMYENYSHIDDLLKTLESGYYNSAFSLDDRLAYGAVSYR